MLNSAIFLMFAFSFFKPNTARDWRTFGAFIVALFVEMYGFPLSIYLMWGWLQTKYPNLDLMSHNTGHLWSTLLGEKGDPHFGPLHIASYVFLGLGCYLLSSAWNVLYHATKRPRCASASVPNSKTMQHAPPAFCRHGNVKVQRPEQTASTAFSILTSQEQTACKHSASMSAA